MNLTPEQKKTIAQWIAAGDSLSTVQKKLADELKISLTYRDVRFLIDDLNLELKDTAPKVDASDVTKARATPDDGARGSGERRGFFDKAKEKLGVRKQEPEPAEADIDEEDYEEVPPAGPSNVTVTVDKITAIAGALASGTVTFSDGVTGKWVVDQYGRPGFTQISKPGYRPKPADSQAFMQELNLALQRHGF